LLPQRAELLGGPAPPRKRPRTPSDDRTAGRVAGTGAFDLLSRAAAGEGGNLRADAKIDERYLQRPFFGSRKRAVEWGVHRPRAPRLMRLRGIEAPYAQPPVSRPAPGPEVDPYWWRQVTLEAPPHVWSTDIPSIPRQGGFLSLGAGRDWFRRFVLAGERSHTLDVSFCSAALDTAFGFGQPSIWNSDRGSPLTSAEFLAPLKQRPIALRRDGRGRALDQVFLERWWRSLQYELIAPGDFQHGAALLAARTDYFDLYHGQRPHQALGCRTPADWLPHQHKRKKPCS
jgi:putative transposase